MTEFYLQVALIFLAVLLSIITTLMGYMAVGMNKLSINVAVLGSGQISSNKTLDEIREELKTTTKASDQEIKTLHTNYSSLLSRVELLHEKSRMRQK